MRHAFEPLGEKQQASLVVPADAQSDIVSGMGWVNSRAYLHGRYVMLQDSRDSCRRRRLVIQPDASIRTGGAIFEDMQVDVCAHYFLTAADAEDTILCEPSSFMQPKPLISLSLRNQYSTIHHGRRSRSVDPGLHKVGCSSEVPQTLFPKAMYRTDHQTQLCSCKRPACCSSPVPLGLSDRLCSRPATPDHLCRFSCEHSSALFLDVLRPKQRCWPSEVRTLHCQVLRACQDPVL